MAWLKKEGSGCRCLVLRIGKFNAPLLRQGRLRGALRRGLRRGASHGEGRARALVVYKVRDLKAGHPPYGSEHCDRKSSMCARECTRVSNRTCTARFREHAVPVRLR